MRIIIAAVVLLLASVGTICFFPGISRRAEEIFKQSEAFVEENQELNTDILSEIYKGAYVLYLETMQRQDAQTSQNAGSAADIYLEMADTENADDFGDTTVPEWVDQRLDDLTQYFENYRLDIDYCIWGDEENFEKNTTRPLEYLFTEKDKISALDGDYESYFVLNFDENGKMTVTSIYSQNGNEDEIMKALGQVDWNNIIWKEIEADVIAYGYTCNLLKPSNFTIAFGFPLNGNYSLVFDGWKTMSDEYMDYWTMINVYRQAGALFLYFGMLACIAGLVFLLSSRRVWKTEIPMARSGKWYLAEAAIAGVICTLCMQNSFISIIWNINKSGEYSTAAYLFMGGNIFRWLDFCLYIYLIYVIWFLSFSFLRPVFSLGVREYVRQYSFIYQIFPWLKQKWENFKTEVGHIDFSEKTTKTIAKIVVINFVVLSVCSCLWFFGIGVLVVYSLLVFFLMKDYRDKIAHNYRALLSGVNKIAEGDLETEITEDLGVFEPFKEELGRIRFGFKKAVDEEVKSQRMKTELITNVSHDLKTPLTAITTYVELLKKENLTDEERRSYIETLEKKSLRLKVLIEDLFEVSKATSNTITLNPIEVDVVNLIKQVSIEHTDKFQQMGLELRWRVPEEKVILYLDNQKTYRIFENLFVNIQKYAMPNSRVYIDVMKVSGVKEKAGVTVNTGKAENVDGTEKPEAFKKAAGTKNVGEVEITIKNMSAEELTVRADEITERFVRGDSSRNTEGSGLGLAIAKSFVEAQGGSFRVDVDGDLFKVILCWKCTDFS